MDDLNKSYQQMGKEILAEKGGVASMQGGGGGDGVALFKQFEQQIEQETGNPSGSDGALMATTRRVFDEVVAPMPDEMLQGLTAVDAASMLFGFPDSAREFPEGFDQMDAGSKRRIIEEVINSDGGGMPAGSGDMLMEQEQGDQAQQMQMR